LGRVQVENLFYSGGSKLIYGELNMRTVFPIGTTIYAPEKCHNGYTLYSQAENMDMSHSKNVCLIDMNGNVVNKWDITAGRAKLLKNGNLLVLEGEYLGGGEVVREYEWDGRLVWEYEATRLPGRAHHDFERLSNGNTLILSTEELPAEYKEKVEDTRRRSARAIRGDAVFEVTPAKEVVWEWHMYKHVDINRYCKMCNPADWSHCNLVRALPENKRYEAGDKRFKPGNVILSPRNLGFIFIVDRDTKDVVWEYAGKYAGGLAGQHESHMIQKGLPGEGNILIFDNGAPPMRSLAHNGRSYVLEVDPVQKKVVWKYENMFKFYSAFQSSVQRLPNGNTLICESCGSRLFEVTQEGEIVWEYAVEWHRVFGRASRYPYDYCPQLRTLKKPKETAVVPPPYVRTNAVRLTTPPFTPRKEG
jgi:hypothetical protein